MTAYAAEEAPGTAHPAGTVQEAGRGNRSGSQGSGPEGRWLAEAFASRQKLDLTAHRLITLLELLKTYGVLFHRCSGQLAKIITDLPDSENIVSGPDGEFVRLFVSGELLPLLEEFDLQSTKDETIRLAEMMDVGKVKYLKLKEFLKSISRRFVDDLKRIHFFYVRSPGYYTNSLDGWAPVIARFARLTFDIDEAEKSFALNRFTACVFHLMRVVEAGVQEWGSSLGVANPTEKEWGAISNEIKQKVDNLTDTTPAEKELKAAMHDVKAHLDSVRWAWRNPTMHPKQTYTEDEAAPLLERVREFMVRLVSLGVDEPKLYAYAKRRLSHHPSDCRTERTMR